MRLPANSKRSLLAVGCALCFAAVAPAQSNDPNNPASRTGAGQSTPGVQSQTEQKPHTGVVETPQAGAHSGQAHGTSTSGQSGTGNRSRAGSSMGSDAMVGQQDRAFIEKAAASGMMEVHLARLAQTKATNDEVKQFAAKLEKDHSEANKKLTDIAQQKGVTMPTSMDPKHQAQVTKLEALSGEQFDRAYTKALVQHHRNDVKEFQRQSQRSMDTHVKTFAEQTLPTLQAHLQQSQTLAQSVSGKGSRSRSSDTNMNNSGASGASAGGASGASGTSRSTGAGSSTGGSNSQGAGQGTRPEGGNNPSTTR